VTRYIFPLTQRSNWQRRRIFVLGLACRVLSWHYNLSFAKNDAPRVALIRSIIVLVRDGPPMVRRPKYALKLRIDGPGVHSGTISVPDLLRICQAAQDAVNRQAEAMRGGLSLRPGPKTSEVYDECTLELVGIEKGSTILPFRLAKPQQSLPIPGAMTFGADVITQVVTTVKTVGGTRSGYEFEPGVLDSLRVLGEVLEKKRISKIEWIVPGRPGAKAIKAVFDKRVRDRVLRKIKTPSQKPESVEGILEMADFKEQEHKCRIHPAVGQPIACIFDESQEDQVYQSLRKPVRVTGIAKINSNTGKIDELHIEKIVIVEPLLTGGRDFFTERSIEQLAEVQGVKPLKNPKTFAGGWPADQDVDAFLEEIYSSR
jgi:hypothetical protein